MIQDVNQPVESPISQKKEKKNNKILLVVVISSVIFSLITVEYALKKLGYKNYTSSFSFVSEPDTVWNKLEYFQLDKKLIYAIKLNTLYDDFNGTDKLGFRINTNKDRPVNPQQKIITVGDSFTYGSGVKHDKTYPTILEQLLNKKAKAVAVYNAGVPGYGVDQEYLYLLDLYKKYHPDILIWNFNMNDVQDADQACLVKIAGNNLEIFPGWSNLLFLQGKLYELIPKYIFNTNIVNAVLFAPNRILHSDRYTLGCSKTLTDQQIMQKTVFLINKVEEKLRENSSKLVVLLTPYQFYFDTGISNKFYAIEDYKKMRDTLASSRASFIDANEEIAKKDAPGIAAMRLNTNVASDLKQPDVLGANSDDLAHRYFLDDGFAFGWRHINELGNNAFASVVFEYIDKYLH
jgi:hypothetical protein